MQTATPVSRPSIIPGALFLLTLTLVGALAGFIYSVKTGRLYESTGIIYIRSNSSLFQEAESLPGLARINTAADLRHDLMIVQAMVIHYCLERYRLYHLETFEDLEEEQVVPWVKEHLNCTQIEDSTILEITFQARAREDAKTFVSNLFRTYKELLDEEVRDSLLRREVAINELERSGVAPEKPEDARLLLQLMKSEKLFEFRILQDGTKGKLVRNDPIFSGIGTLAGLALGLLLLVLLKILRLHAA